MELERMCDLSKLTYAEESQSDNSRQLTIIVPKDVASKMMRNYLKEKSNTITVKGYRKGKVPPGILETILGGKNIYSAMFGSLANDKITESTTERIVSVDDVKVFYHNNGQVIFTCKAWYEPKLVVPDAIALHSDTWPVVKLTPPYVNPEPLWQQKLREFANSNPYLHSKEDAQGNGLPAAEGDIVEVQVDASVDGEKFERGCEASTRITLVDGTVHPKILYKKLIGSKVGNYINIDVVPKDDLPPSFKKEIDDRELSLRVKVLHVFTPDLKDLSDTTTIDELAVTAGYSNASEFTKALRDSAANYAKHVEKVSRRQMVIDYLVEMFQKPEIPESWIKNRKEELKNQTEDDIKTGITQYLVLKYTGMALGLKWDDPESTGIQRMNGNAYIEKVLEYLCERMFSDANGDSAKQIEASVGQPTQSP